MTQHVMFRSDELAGTKLGKFLASVRITEDAIDNGLIIALDGLATNERELRTYSTPAANTPFGKIAILGSEEVDTAKTYNSVGAFTNKKGALARAYILEHGDVFSVTAGAFDAVPTVGKVIELQAGNKMKVVETATEGSTVLGTCEAVETEGATTWYVVRVATN